MSGWIYGVRAALYIATVTDPVKRGLIPRPEPDERDRLVAAIEGAHLQEWERLFCCWFAQHPKKRKATQLHVASTLKGDPVTWAELRDIRLSRPFIEHLHRERDFLREMQEARAGFIENYPLAATVWGKSLRALDAELDTDGADKLNAVRAATPLLTSVMDRLHPKKDEHQGVSTAIQVNLTVHQAKYLDAPALGFDAQAIEIVAEELAPDASDP